MVKPIVAVNAVIINENNHFLLTQRCDNNLWCIPGGIVEQGESIREALVREVKEEINVTCNIIHLIGIYSNNNKIITAPTKKPSIVLAFRCIIFEGIPSESDEVCSLNYFSIDNLPSLLANHHERLLDALSFNGTPVIN